MIWKGDNMHEYAVELRIVASHLELDQITRELGLNPTQVRKKGGRRGPNRVWTEDMWSFEVFPSEGKSWPSLDAGLTALIRLLLPRKECLRSYASPMSVCLWCGHFSSEFDGGPTLSSHVLGLLAELGIELHLDTYHHSSRRQSARPKARRSNNA